MAFYWIHQGIIIMHVFALVSAYTCVDITDLCNSTQHLLLQFWLLSSSCCNGQLGPQLHLLSWYRQDLLLQTTVCTYQKEVNGTKDTVSTEWSKASFAFILILSCMKCQYMYTTSCENCKQCRIPRAWASCLCTMISAYLRMGEVKWV